VLEENDSNAQVKRDFYAKDFQLKELSLQLFILYKEIMMWK
jgi:hypothetical protein